MQIVDLEIRPGAVIFFLKIILFLIIVGVGILNLVLPFWYNDIYIIYMILSIGVTKFSGIFFFLILLGWFYDCKLKNISLEW